VKRLKKPAKDKGLFAVSEKLHFEDNRKSLKSFKQVNHNHFLTHKKSESSIGTVLLTQEGKDFTC
jgi:hypothetical protein